MPKMRLAYIPSLAAAQAVSFRNPAALFDGLLVARHCGIDAEIVQRLIDNFPSWMVPDVEWPDEIVRDIAEVDRYGRRGVGEGGSAFTGAVCR
jgi:hypothetical protein